MKLKHIDKPTFPSNSKALITTKDQFKRFDREWKKIVAEDRLRHDSQFAPLMIFRNIVLGQDIYKGFTPSYKLNNLKNGYGFMDGWTRAYTRLYYTTRINNSGTMDILSLSLYRLMVAALGRFNMSQLSNYMINPSKFQIVHADTYMDRVQNHLISQIEDGDFTRHTNIQAVLNEAEKSCMYGIIKEEDLESFLSDSESKKTLKDFADMWLGLEGRNNIETLIDSKIHETDRKHLKGMKAIFITTKLNNAKKRQQYVLPLSHLWETEWINEYS